jgi:hypothetical protein
MNRHYADIFDSISNWFWQNRSKQCPPSSAGDAWKGVAMDLALFVAACCTIMGFALNITDRVQRRIKRRKKMMRKK